MLETPPDEPLSEYCNATRQVVDAEILGDRVVLRHRKDGDRFQPLGMEGTRKLKDYLNDLGLPLEQRDALVLITNGEEIVWIVGHAVSHYFSATDSTRRLIQIDVSPA